MNEEKQELKKSQMMMQDYSNQMAQLGDMFMAKDAMTDNMKRMDDQIEKMKIKARNLLVNIEHQQRKEMHKGDKNESHAESTPDEVVQNIIDQDGKSSLPISDADLASSHLVS